MKSKISLTSTGLVSLLELEVVVGQFSMTSRSGSENEKLRLLIKNCRLPY